MTDPAGPTRAPAPDDVTRARRGDETRSRILAAALRTFAAHGYKGSTTRRIAEDAGVNLPALKYYFGGKEGLYLACADEIVAAYERHMLALVAEAHQAVQGRLTANDARSRLKSVVMRLAEILIDSPDAEARTAFALRELADRGPAFDVLYRRLWEPGVELTAALVARVRGEAAVTPADRIEALLLISSLSAFSIAKPVAKRLLGWPDVSDQHLVQVKAVVESLIDRLGGDR